MMTETQCCICLESLNGTRNTTLKCGHCFHTDCILENIAKAKNSKNKCPLCRANICSDINQEDFNKLNRLLRVAQSDYEFFEDAFSYSMDFSKSQSIRIINLRKEIKRLREHIIKTSEFLTKSKSIKVINPEQETKRLRKIMSKAAETTITDIDDNWLLKNEFKSHISGDNVNSSIYVDKFGYKTRKDGHNRDGSNMIMGLEFIEDNIVKGVKFRDEIIDAYIDVDGFAFNIDGEKIGEIMDWWDAGAADYEVI